MSPEDGQEEDFEQMLEASLEAEVFQEGQTIEGRIVALDAEVAFIDVGAKGEATIDLAELADADGAVDVEVGDIVQAVVVSTGPGGLKLSHRLARGAATREKLGEAFRAGLPVEGRVEKSIRGGYEVRIAGQRAFCPISQIDKSFTSDPAVHEGKVYTFRIVELDREGKNLVVSRRALIEEEERERADEVRSTIVPGAVLAGRVASVRPYGAFVDLGGGIQGLLHVSEMGWSRIADPLEVVRPGDDVTVKVLRVEEGEKGKISLGLKQLQADPWSTAEDTYEVGQVLRARVTRVAEFGAFVELEPGIEGLAHVSTFPPSGKQGAWRDTVAPGSSVAVEILSIDMERKRIGVAVVEEGSVKAAGARELSITAGARLVGKVERHERYGVFVFLAPGRTGLIPLSETGIERETDVAKLLPVGADVEVAVLEVDQSGRRIRLSRKAVLEAAQKTEMRDYTERQESQKSGGFGSMADKLRDALDKKN